MGYITVTNALNDNTATSDITKVGTNFTNITDGLSDGSKDINVAAIAGTSINVGNGVISDLYYGTYTPTYTAVGGGNVDSCTPYTSIWARIGNVCLVAGTMQIDLTSANADSYVQFSAPIASTMTSQYDCSGTLTTGSSTFKVGQGNIYFEVGQGIRANLTCNDAAVHTYGFTFYYIIK